MFTPADVSELVGTQTLARGEEYFASGQVVTVARNGDGTTIVGQVRGSSRKSYVAVVELTSAGENAKPRYGRCTCPVRLNCKHVAATLLAYLDKQVPREPDPAPQVRRTSEWERTFADLLAVPDDTVEPTEPRTPRLRDWDRRTSHEIALQVELLPEPTTTRRGEPRATQVRSPRLGMRPVTRSATGRWVRTGVAWSELRFLGYRHGTYPDGHVDVLRSLFGLASSVSDAAYFNAPTWIHADELPSAALWALLVEARRVGLPMVHSDKAQSPVFLTEDPARTRLTVTRTDSGLSVSGALLLDDTEIRPARLVETTGEEPGVLGLDRTVLLGTPPTGLYTWRSHGPPGKETRVLLAQLAAPVDSTTLSLVDRPEPLAVPAADERRFLSRVFPVLRDRFDVLDVDAGIEVPRPPRPRLHLEVTQLPEHGARLLWQWAYTVESEDGAPRRITVPFVPVPGPAPRDPEAESALVDRLDGRAPRLPALPAVLPGRGASTRASARRTALSAPLADAGQEELRGMETARFFTDELPVLVELAAAEADFSVAVFDGGGDAVDYRRAEDVDITVTTSTLPETRDWFDLAVIIKVGTQFIPFGEVFTALAKGKSSLLLVDGLHFSLDDERFERLRALIEEARAMQDTMGETLRVSRYQAGMFAELETLGVLDTQAESWRAAVGDLAGGARPGPVPSPEGLDATMRAYQQEGFEWLDFLRRHRLGGVLADDMGLGKTIQTLALVQHLHDETPDPADRAPVLVVAPTSVVGNWAAEAARFTPGLRVVTVHETLARRRTPLAELVDGADVVVTSYALFRLGFDEHAALPWAGLVLDEAQFVKNHQSVAYQCARRLDTPFKVALTGTPLENNLMELWSILSVVSPGLFPSAAKFQDYYARPIEKEGDEGRLAMLRRRVAPFMLRRTKEDVAKDLPAKQEQIVDVVLNPRHRAAYDAYLQRERTKVLGLVDKFGEHRFEVFRSLTVLRQASLDVSLVDAEHEKIPSSKLTVLFEMLDDILAEGHSVLVFSQFTQFLGRVRDHLDKHSVDYSYLDGRTRKRTETIERFTSGETKAFLISLKAGGFGLNLTAADYCILLDPWWNPAAEAQAVDRAHRIGQTRHVNVYRMVATDTIEEKVMALKESKSTLFSSVLDGGAAGGSGLTADDVRELLE